MRAKEADQIKDSGRNTTVYYKNTPVVIQEVFENENKARVRCSTTNKEMVVQVKHLNEHHGHKMR